ncbi:AMP-binding protein [Geodermatophilus marinus]|uniref:AMP-binding protein n=1 Tax=Geodermatophilus sp. LHW52908 TaxID=2303986 RepID=UPI000E3B5E9A|nr:AMP-binding protein [Geodermatophilus sp. LHW52908]RFU21953.1 acyl-CoA synthetase [Geodermatophilus sp. LHW52908]
MGTQARRSGRPRDLPDLLGRLVRQDPDAVVALDKGPDGGTVPVTRRELWQRVGALARDLGAAGVGAGDCVAVWLPNWSDALAWQFAAAARSAHVVGINTRYNVGEVAHVLGRARPRLVALPQDFHGLDLVGRLREAVAHAPWPAPGVALVPGPGRGRPDPAAVAAADVGGGAWTPSRTAAPPALPDPDPGALAVAFTTSGSTGMPKLAAHTAAGVLSHAVADAAVLGIGPGEHVLCALPLSGTFGHTLAMAALAAGGVCVLEPVFDPAAVLDDMAAHAVTHVASGDDLVARLAEAWQEHPRDLSSWRWWGAADFQGRVGELAAWAAETFGTTTCGVYGSSELFALTAVRPLDEPAPGRWLGGGRVVHEGIEVRVADPVTGAVLPHGREGELQFRGPNVVDAYLGDAAVAGRSSTADGWFRSGDLGLQTAVDAFAYVVRMGDALRLRGFLVDPAEIEQRLVAHPDVGIAKVVGVQDADGATAAVGFVQAAGGRAPDPAELRRWCASALAGFKVPAAVHVLEAMPTTSGTNGTKIRADVLREWAQRLSG